MPLGRARAREIPKPKTGGGAPARRSRSIRPAIELSARVSAGDAGSADAISVGFRKACDTLEGRLRGVRSGDHHEVQSGLIGLTHEGLGFERRHVGDEQAVGSCLGRLAHESDPVHDEIRVGQNSQRNMRMAGPKVWRSAQSSPRLGPPNRARASPRPGSRARRRPGPRRGFRPRPYRRRRRRRRRANARWFRGPDRRASRMRQTRPPTRSASRSNIAA